MCPYILHVRIGTRIILLMSWFNAKYQCNIFHFMLQDILSIGRSYPSSLCVLYTSSTCPSSPCHCTGYVTLCVVLYDSSMNLISFPCLNMVRSSCFVDTGGKRSHSDESVVMATIQWCRERRPEGGLWE